MPQTGLNTYVGMCPTPVIIFVEECRESAVTRARARVELTPDDNAVRLRQYNTTAHPHVNRKPSESAVN
jgi:hypothetical protein